MCIRSTLCMTMFHCVAWLHVVIAAWGQINPIGSIWCFRSVQFILVFRKKCVRRLISKTDMSRRLGCSNNEFYVPDSFCLCYILLWQYWSRNLFMKTEFLKLHMRGYSHFENIIFVNLFTNFDGFNLFGKNSETVFVKY